MSSFDMTVIALLAGIWLACGLGGVVILIGAWRRPHDDIDERCAAIDSELSERERAARLMGGGFKS